MEKSFKIRDKRDKRDTDVSLWKSYQVAPSACDLPHSQPIYAAKVGGVSRILNLKNDVVLFFLFFKGNLLQNFGDIVFRNKQDMLCFPGPETSDLDSI